MTIQKKLTLLSAIATMAFLVFVALPVLAQVDPPVWNPPVSTPPDCDPASDGDGCYPPINVSPTLQEKKGSLIIDGESVLVGTTTMGSLVQLLDGGTGADLKIGPGAKRDGELGYKLNTAGNSKNLDIIGVSQDGLGNAGDRRVKIWDNLIISGWASTTNIYATNICTGPGACHSLTEIFNILAGSWSKSLNNVGIYYPGTIGVGGTSRPNSGLDIAIGADTTGIGSATANSLDFWTSGVTRLTLTSDGQVQIPAGKPLCLGADCRSVWPDGGTGSGVTKIIAGDGITVNPTTGVGAVIVGALSSTTLGGTETYQTLHWQGGKWIPDSLLKTNGFDHVTIGKLIKPDGSAGTNALVVAGGIDTDSLIADSGIVWGGLIYPTNAAYNQFGLEATTATTDKRGRMGYHLFSADSLDIVGTNAAGATNRKVNIYDNLNVAGTTTSNTFVANFICSVTGTCKTVEDILNITTGSDLWKRIGTTGNTFATKVLDPATVRTFVGIANDAPSIELEAGNATYASSAYVGVRSATDKFAGFRWANGVNNLWWMYKPANGTLSDSGNSLTDALILGNTPAGGTNATPKVIFGNGTGAMNKGYTMEVKGDAKAVSLTGNNLIVLNPASTVPTNTGIKLGNSNVTEDSILYVGTQADAGGQREVMLKPLSSISGTGGGLWTASGANISNSNTGNVGIGTGATAPGLKTEIDGTEGLPATSGTAQTGILRLAYPTAVGQWVMDMGVKSGIGGWLQATNRTGLNNNGALLLNPNGGNVGIGLSTAPAAKLDVAGTGFFSAGLYGATVQSDKFCIGTSCLTAWPTGATPYTGSTGITIAGTVISAQNTSALWNASSLQGKAVTATVPTSGQVLKFNGTSWAPAADAGGSTYTAGTGLSLAGTVFSAQNTTALWNASSLQGKAVTATAPASGQVLKFNGTSWAPAAESAGGVTSIVASTGITATNNAGAVTISSSVSPNITSCDYRRSGTGPLTLQSTSIGGGASCSITGDSGVSAVIVSCPSGRSAISGGAQCGPAGFLNASMRNPNSTNQWWVLCTNSSGSMQMVDSASVTCVK